MKQKKVGLMAVMLVVALFTVQCAGSAAPTATPPPTDTPVPPTQTPEPTVQMPEASGESLFTYVTETSPYGEWGTWPTDEFNDFSGLLTSGPPHGGVVRIYVNDVALAAAEDFTGELPVDSIILKENYTGTMVDDPGDLDALTIMYKVEGYNPDHGDWFWLKVFPDGTIAAEGKVAGCTGCHGQANNKDYVLRYGFGEEPAVKNQGQPAEVESVTVTIDGFTFGDGELTITTGTTVLWQHDHSAPHTVTADDGLFDSGNMVAGDDFSITFTEAGEYSYYCRYHGGPGGKGMAGKIIVVEQ